MINFNLSAGNIYTWKIISEGGLPSFWALGFRCLCSLACGCVVRRIASTIQIIKTLTNENKFIYCQAYVLALLHFGL